MREYFWILCLVCCLWQVCLALAIVFLAPVNLFSCDPTFWILLSVRDYCTPQVYNPSGSITHPRHVTDPRVCWPVLLELFQFAVNPFYFWALFRYVPFFVNIILAEAGVSCVLLLLYLWAHNQHRCGLEKRWRAFISCSVLLHKAFFPPES